jgi:hypothetical protein
MLLASLMLASLVFLFLSVVGFPVAAGVPAVAGNPDVAVALLLL